jgi:hypothetical protein
MPDHETEIRQTLVNERDNAEIVRRYNQAIEIGTDSWVSGGCKGSLIEAVQEQIKRVFK